jgi:hypothetical protein
VPVGLSHHERLAFGSMKQTRAFSVLKTTNSPTAHAKHGRGTWHAVRRPGGQAARRRVPDLESLIHLRAVGQRARLERLGEAGRTLLALAPGCLAHFPVSPSAASHRLPNRRNECFCISLAPSILPFKHAQQDAPCDVFQNVFIVQAVEPRPQKLSYLQ